MSTIKGANKHAWSYTARTYNVDAFVMEEINRGADMPFAEACQLEASLFGLAAATDDMREGTAAFLEKRKPVFKGR